MCLCVCLLFDSPPTLPRQPPTPLPIRQSPTGLPLSQAAAAAGGERRGERVDRFFVSRHASRRPSPSPSHLHVARTAATSPASSRETTSANKSGGREGHMAEAFCGPRTRRFRNL